MQLGHVQNTMLSFTNSDEVEQAGGFSMSLQSAKTFVLNLGDLYAVSAYRELEQENPNEFKAMNKSIALMLVYSVHGIFILSLE